MPGARGPQEQWNYWKELLGGSFRTTELILLWREQNKRGALEKEGFPQIPLLPPSSVPPKSLSSHPQCPQRGEAFECVLLKDEFSPGDVSGTWQLLLEEPGGGICSNPSGCLRAEGGGFSQGLTKLLEFHSGKKARGRGLVSSEEAGPEEEHWEGARAL